MTLLSVEDLSISFEVEATRGVAFELHRGRVLALVGESGSGKSVSAMSILGLLPATATVTGSITLEGEQLLGARPERLRELRGGKIGTIFQEPMTAFNPVFTIGNQIAEALRTHRRAAPKQRIHELLSIVGLDDPPRVARSYPHQLSGGQLQRAMIAMAISCDPVLLIADEPTTALDVTAQAGILELLRDLRERLGMAILLITHDMGVVADLADDVVVLNQGRVVETAPVGQLFAAPAEDYTRALLDAVPKLGSSPSPVLAETGPDALRLTDLVVDYSGGFRAVDGVSLGVGGGEILGLVGESGSGKSTIGRVVAGLVPATSGVALVGGADIGRAARHPWRRAAELRRIRSGIGIVFQDPASSLNPRVTIADSIAEPLVLHRELDAVALRRRVDELLEAVQLSVGLRSRYPYEMSGGQRQRVALARALALNPALLIADEPTSALDVSVQARVLDLLRSLQRDFGFACLFISHDLAVVEQLAHRVAVMHRGQIVEQGRTADVLRAPEHPYTQGLIAAVPVPDPARRH
ncbi:ABC transporter ATP-binding protein [Actinoplanes sp. NPDC049596]|uniref:ABC transporter ATP-binding protein n=1 Tax=unclassified Actinoplanes TaxID=2626549 RepID=UPI0034308624